MSNVCDFESHMYFINMKTVYLHITTYEMTQSSCKREARSKSHPGSKLAPVRVFLCKHPLSLCVVCFRAPNSQTWFISEILNFCSRYRQTRSYISSLKVKYILVGHYFGKSTSRAHRKLFTRINYVHWWLFFNNSRDSLVFIMNDSQNSLTHL